MNYVVYCSSIIDSKILATSRIARWIRDHLDGDVQTVDDNNLATFEPPAEFTMFMVNTPLTMVHARGIPQKDAGYKLEDLLYKATKLVHVQNDYSVRSPAPDLTGMSIVVKSWTMRQNEGRSAMVWSTCRDRCDKHPSMYSYINWNALAFQEMMTPMNNRIDDRVFYFGAYRKDREAEFDRYMRRSDDLFIISAPSRGQTLFKERYGFADDQVHDLIKIPDDLTKYAFTLYIEDDMSHRQYHSPANRFYEALSANMAILVDRQAAGTLRKAGYNVPMAAIVDSPATVRRAMGYREQILSAQKAWRTDPKTGLPHDQAVLARFKELLATLS
jgi:hypothetical protein